MGFFQTFSGWLDGQLASYIGNNTAKVAAVLSPVLISLATVYVMVWGYLQLTGQVEEPFVTGVKRIARLAVILGVCLQLWLYNTVLVDSVYEAPAQLAASVTGAADPVMILDAIWDSGGTVAGALWSNGSVYSGDAGFYLAGLGLWALVGLLCTYTMFLFALSRVALSVLLALGPLFIMAGLFDVSRRYFDAWVAQLASYAFITILTAMVAALLLQLVQSYATQTAARGSNIATVDVLDLALVSGLALLFMRQVMPIAAALGGGVPLSTQGVLSRTLAWSLQGPGLTLRTWLGAD